MYHNNTLVCALAALILTVLGPQICSAQDGTGPRTPSDEPPGLIETLDAYVQMEPWVRSLEVPEGAIGPNVIGACVTLRFDGKVMGIGTIYGGGQFSVPEATRLAVLQARTRLPITQDAMADERMRLAAEQMTISLELAGPAVPLGKGTYEQVAALFQPGIHGVALRIDDFASASYPGEMLWMQQEPSSALQRLIAGMTGDVALSLRPLEEVLEAENVSVLRFKTRHVAQLKAGGEPRLLERGGKFVSANSVRSQRAIEEWADGLASFLIGMRSVGTYNPIAGVASEPATPLTSAMRMYALFRYANLGRESELTSRARQEATNTANALLTLIAEGNRIGAPADALLAVCFAQGLEYDESLGDAKQKLPRALNSMAGKIEEFPPAQRPMIAWALASIGEREKANEIMPACRRVESQGMYPSLMPWLGYAELELAGESEIPSAVALRLMRSKMWENQLTLEDVRGYSPDLQGGIVFTAARNPAPTWAASRPMSFVAAMLGDARFTTPEELPSEMSDLFDSMRFLRQLSAGDHESHMYQEPSRAMWGTRAALWSQDMPIPASALTLLTVCETLESLEELAADSGAP
ncbi:MAG: hypothetical protein Phyf2KO_01400 [Phycisphaerales bacterium]